MHYLAELKDYFDIPCHLYLKDKAGKILECNDYQAKSAGFEKSSDMIGMTNNDLLPSDLAKIITQNDQETLATEALKICPERGAFINPSASLNITDIYLSYKFPYYNTRGKIIGLMGISFDMKNHPIININASSPFIRHIARCTQNNLTMQLSDQQKICLQYVAKGNTSKEIAQAMHLSPRTIEHYIEIMKTKFGCEHKRDLISLFNSQRFL